MSTDEPDNANPTILNPSDLPTRHHPTSTYQRSDGGTGLFDRLAPSPAFLIDPLELVISPSDSEPEEVEEIDEQEIYGMSLKTNFSIPFALMHLESRARKVVILTFPLTDLISSISDPEHPLSLGSLSVVQLQDIHIYPPTSPRSQISTVVVDITPTITHCSLATVIGLGVRVRLEQALPPRFRVDVKVKKGTHSSDDAVSKQLSDKERVAAALENQTLMGVVKKMLGTCH